MKNYLSELVRFAGVGGVGTAFHYGVLIIGVEILSLSSHLSTICGFTVGAIVNFLLSRQFVFTESKQPIVKSLRRFFTVATFGAAVNQLVFSFAVLIWHYLAAQCLATVLVFISSYLLNKYWVFNPYR